MENASKALIMAGGILIGVLILSLAVYLITILVDHSMTIQKRMDDEVIAEFNQNFYKYMDGQTLTIHDIVSIANFAKSNNSKYEVTSGQRYYVTVTISSLGLADLSGMNEIKLTDLIKLHSDKSFLCYSISVDDTTQRVNQIIFKFK